jgi:hypothetical protein
MFHFIFWQNFTLHFGIVIPQQPVQDVALLDPVMRSQGRVIHGQKIFRIVVLDSFVFPGRASPSPTNFPHNSDEPNENRPNPQPVFIFINSPKT